MRMAQKAVQDIINTQLQLKNGSNHSSIVDGIYSAVSPQNLPSLADLDLDAELSSQLKLIQQQRKSDELNSETILTNDGVEIEIPINENDKLMINSSGGSVLRRESIVNDITEPSQANSLTTNNVQQKVNKQVTNRPNWGHFTVPLKLKEYVEKIWLQEAIDLYRTFGNPNHNNNSNTNGIVVPTIDRTKKSERGRVEGALRAKISRIISEDPEWSQTHIVLRSMATEDVMSQAFRQAVLEGSRVDGRHHTELREVSSQYISLFICIVPL